MSYAKDSFAYAIRKLFQNRENDEKVDWTIVSKDGTKFPVHSYVIMNMSDVLMAAMTGDFKEKEEKMYKIEDFTNKAVEYFVKFLYCYEISNINLDLETLKELIMMGDMYNVEGLKKAASINLEKLYTMENIVEILEFMKKFPDEHEKCLQYIVANFQYSRLQSGGVLNKHPEISKLYMDLKAKDQASSSNRCYCYCMGDENLMKLGKAYSKHFPHGRC